MSVGIYVIYWKNLNKVYIGQSCNVEKRWSDHLSKMKKGKHENTKIQACYDNFGEPEHCLIEICKIDELDNLEIIWCDEFNSLHNGLNINEPGTVGGRGVDSPASKYSKRKILRVFSRLYRTDLSYSEIAKLENVHKSLPSTIIGGIHHIWIQEEYWDKFVIAKYKALQRTGGRGDILSRTGSTKKIVSPDGTEFEISNMTVFCKEHRLNLPSLSELLSGKRKQYKGWHL